MERAGFNPLPPFRKTSGSKMYTPSGHSFVPLSMTPELRQIPGYKGSYKSITNITNGHNSRTDVCGSPDVVNPMFTGQLSRAHTSDVFIQSKPSTKDPMTRMPTQQRRHSLWEPTNVSRVQARLVIRDIQDARWRRQAQLEKEAEEKALTNRRKSETVRFRQCDIMARGLVDSLKKMDKEKQNYLDSLPPRKKPKQNKDSS